MGLIFYPQDEDINQGTLEERLENLMEAAERYKAVILDVAVAGAEPESDSDNNGYNSTRTLVPRDLKVAYNWDEIAKVLLEVRELPEGDRAEKQMKAQLLTRLSEVYEVLRAAKMPKLEAVRLALVSEASHL